MHPTVERESRDKQRAEIDGYTITYLAQGDPANPPLVLLHGWLMHAGVWRDVMNVFSRDYYCIAPDLLGHGHSQKPASGDYSIAAQARRVLMLLDYLGIDQFALMGHSMGGQISLFLAATLARRRVTKLVDVAGVATGRTSHYTIRVIAPGLIIGGLFPALWALTRRAMRYGWYRRIYIEKLLFSDSWRSHYDDPTTQMAILPGIGRPALRCAIAIIVTDLTPLLGKITAPTLVIFGSEDNTVPVAEGYFATEHVPVSSLIAYEGCGHMPMIERRDDFVAAVRKFLEGGST